MDRHGGFNPREAPATLLANLRDRTLVAGFCLAVTAVLFQRVGHRIIGVRRHGCSRGAGDEKVHVVVDDATQLAYVEDLHDDQQETTAGFLVHEV